MAANRDPHHWVPLAESGYDEEDFGPILLWMLFEGTTSRFDVPEAWLTTKYMEWIDHNQALGDSISPWPRGMRVKSQVTQHFAKGVVDGVPTIAFASFSQGLATWQRLEEDPRFSAFIKAVKTPEMLLPPDPMARLPRDEGASSSQAPSQPARPPAPVMTEATRLGARSKAPPGPPPKATPDSPRGANTIVDLPSSAEIPLARLFPNLQRTFPTQAQLSPGNTFSLCSVCEARCFGRDLSNNCAGCHRGTAVIYRITAANTARQTVAAVPRVARDAQTVEGSPPPRKQPAPRPKRPPPPPPPALWP